MVKVKLLQSRVTADAAQNAGDVVDVSAEAAQRMIENGTAEMVREAKKPEKAIKKG